MVVAFSCKTRFCPSCVSRRMHAVSLDLEQRVLPVVPYRHWVLALPVEHRFLLARDEVLLGKLREIFARSVQAWLRAKARSLGVPHALTGAIVFTQRFSSRLLVYPHFHAVIPDGAFAEDASGKLVFHALRPNQEDVEKIVVRVAKKASRLFKQLDLEALEPAPLDRLRLQAAQGELPLKIDAAPPGPGRLLAKASGFSLQAARHLHAHDRQGLAFLVRYNLRPPISNARLREVPGGKVLLTFKRPLADGSAALVLEPVALLRRLAALVPAPGSHDTSYFGFLSSHSAHRKKFVRTRRTHPDAPGHPGLCERDEELSTVPPGEEPLAGAEPGERYLRWAELMRKVWGFQVLDCPCGGKRKFVEEVSSPDQIRKTLERLGLWRAPLPWATARPPSQARFFDRHSACDGLHPPAPDD